MSSILPKWLRVTWLCLSPLALLFAVRFAWANAFLDWAENPQILRFGLAHVFTFFVISGLLCSFGLALWLAVAVIFMVKDRKSLSRADAAMIALCLFVLVALLIPQWPLA